jgi:hypothetical protein
MQYEDTHLSTYDSVCPEKLKDILEYHHVEKADHSGRVVWGMNYLRPLEHWGHGFESHSKYGWLSAFIRCLYFPVHVAALRRADPPSKESHWL